jgi:uncharacterized RDD family membrane protein YckC
MDCPTSGDIAAEAQTPDSSPELFEVEGGGQPANDAYWRSEVAARLERYRSRRKPRAPRYPTLRLPFDSAENHLLPVAAEAPRPAVAASSPVRQNVALRAEIISEEQPAISTHPPAPPLAEPRATQPQAGATVIEYESNLIEFPRSAVIPVFQGDELAEPMMDRPRIVEAPEVIPAPPALGGILMETAPNRATDRQKADDFLLRPASLARRVSAGALDVAIMLSGLAAFAAIFQRINPARPALPSLAAGLGFAAGMFWFAYELLFVVYIGGTPGWRIARLRLAKFDGAPVHRNLRRWRVLASFLSAFSIGLGYLWSILDEDGLCWHDRITHTYLCSSDSGNWAP